MVEVQESDHSFFFFVPFFENLESVFGILESVLGGLYGFSKVEGGIFFKTFCYGLGGWCVALFSMGFCV